MVDTDDIIDIIGKKKLKNVISEFSGIEEMDFDFLIKLFSKKELKSLLAKRKEMLKEKAISNIGGEYFSMANSRLIEYQILTLYEQWIKEDEDKKKKKKRGK